ERSALFDESEPQRIELMQRPEFSRRVPPALCQGFELGDLTGVDVGGGIHRYSGSSGGALGKGSDTLAPVCRLVAQAIGIEARKLSIADQMLAGDPDIAHLIAAR